MRASLGTILDFYPASSNLKLRFDKTSSLSFRSWGRRALASGQSQAYKAGEHLATRSLLSHNSMQSKCPHYQRPQNINVKIMNKETQPSDKVRI